MGTLGALFGGVYLALPSGKKTPTQAPPINASSSDEVVTKPTKKAKVAAAGEAATDADSNTYWAVR